jgi:hypothetical protein
MGCSLNIRLIFGSLLMWIRELRVTVIWVKISKSSTNLRKEGYSNKVRFIAVRTAPATLKKYCTLFIDYNIIFDRVFIG